MVGVDGSSLCADSPPKSICLVWGQRCLYSSNEPDELSQWNTVKIGMDTIIIITLCVCDLFAVFMILHNALLGIVFSILLCGIWYALRVLTVVTPSP